MNSYDYFAFAASLIILSALAGIIAGALFVAAVL